jgi:hypothetical protein
VTRVPSAALVLLLLFPISARAAGNVHGTLIDSTTSAPVAGASVRCTSLSDSTQVFTTFTGDDGTFTLLGLSPGQFRVEFARMGYAIYRRTIHVAPGSQDLGKLAMRPSALLLKEVKVKASPPAAVQKGDTTEFSAGAVKTHKNATMEEMVGKLPGVTVDKKSGEVKSNGETIQQVLVDGKSFFGEDPTIALRNLPADVVDKIQVYDKLSDQAEFTGFEDAQTVKTMNFVLRADKRKSNFGNVSGGSGQTRVGGETPYQTNGTAVVNRPTGRVAIIGQANNVNQQNFSTEDLLGILGSKSKSSSSSKRRLGGGQQKNGDRLSGGSSGAGTFLVGPQEGITSTDAIGGHVSANYKGIFDANASAFYNNAATDNLSELTRTYLVPLDSAVDYHEHEPSHGTNQDQRYVGRFQWSPDTSNSVIFRPKFNFQTNGKVAHSIAGNDFAGGVPMDRTDGFTNAAATGHNITNHVHYRHRFMTRGRTFSFDVGAGHQLKDGSESQRAIVDYRSGETDTLDQRTNDRTTTSSFTGRFVYTEPIGRIGALRALFEPSVSESHSNNLGRHFDDVTGAYSIIDPSLTNAFRSTSSSQGAGVGIALGKTRVRMMANLDFQRSTLKVDPSLLAPNPLERTFLDPLPSAGLNVDFANHRALRFSYSTATVTPKVKDLQKVVDNGDPLLLTAGNPDLADPYVQTYVGRYSMTDPKRSRSLFLLLSAQRTGRYIARNTFHAHSDMIYDGIPLKSGTRLITPVNLDRAWNLSSFLTLSRPVRFLQSLLNLNTGVTWNYSPAIIDDVINQSKILAASQGVVLASNISDALDFTIEYTGTWNMARNTTRQTSNADYYTHDMSVRVEATTWRSIVLRQEVSHQYLNGVGIGYGQDVLLWNSSLGERLLKDSIDLRLTASDVLDRNRSTTRTLTDSYIEDTRNLVQPPYVILSATYTWK